MNIAKYPGEHLIASEGGVGEKGAAKPQLAFWLANASVAIFFEVLLVLSYWVGALDTLLSKMDYFQFVLWFASFFMASLLSSIANAKGRGVIKCLWLALVFSFLLYGLSLCHFPHCGLVP